MHTIRKAEIFDAKIIAQITKKAFSVYSEETRTSAVLKALTEDESAVVFDIENNLVYVAEEDGKILGSIRCKGLSCDLAYIYRFGVDPDITSSGIGSALISTVIEQCKKDGFNAIALHTNTKYYSLARYYYGKQFFVHSTTSDRGYIRALFVKELGGEYDIGPALCN